MKKPKRNPKWKFVYSSKTTHTCGLYSWLLNLSLGEIKQLTKAVCSNMCKEALDRKKLRIKREKT